MKNRKKYLKRINNFFRFFDNHNSDNIYETIRKSSLNDVSTKIKKNKEQFIFLIIINLLFLSKKIKNWYK